MRDLFKEGFTAEDFYTLNLEFSFDTPSNVAAELANAILRAALAEAQTVYGGYLGVWGVSEEPGHDSLTARLVAVKPIESESDATKEQT